MAKKPKPKWGWTGGGFLPRFTFDAGTRRVLKRPSYLGSEKFIPALEMAVRTFLTQRNDALEAPRPSEVRAALEELERGANECARRVGKLDVETAELILETLALHGGEVDLLPRLRDELRIFLNVIRLARHELESQSKGRPRKYAHYVLAVQVGHIVRAAGRALNKSRNGPWARTLSVALTAVREEKADPLNYIRAAWQELESLNTSTV